MKLTIILEKLERNGISSKDSWKASTNHIVKDLQHHEEFVFRDTPQEAITTLLNYIGIDNYISKV
jgi:hypothetical protein